MRRYKPYAAELLFILFTVIVGVLGFWGIYAGPRAVPQPHHHLHVATSFGWMALLIVQIALLASGERASHRRLGRVILFAGPLLVASTALLAVHSARRAIAAGEPDILLVQNVTGSVWLGIILFLAFALRKRRKVHGALLVSTLIVFLGPALFFSLIGFAPPFRIEGPETFYRFQTAGMTGLGIILLITLLLFAKDWRNNWPYVLAAAGYPVADGVKAMLADQDLIDPMLRTVALPSEGTAFIVAFAIMFGLLFRTVRPAKPRDLSLQAAARPSAPVDAAAPRTRAATSTAAE